MLYSVTYKLYGETKKNLKDSIIDWAKIHDAVSIDVTVIDVAVDNDVNYEVKISFSTEERCVKFIREMKTTLRID